jgi:glycosyltransferase involved in cell wall biosynthesis
MGRVLILIENQSFPDDRRVWQQSRTLVADGHEVVVVCPRGQVRDRQACERIGSVEVHRYPLTGSGGTALGYAREYGSAVARAARIAWRLHGDAPFDVVQICNPPDLLFLAALPLKLRGARILFDHHDPAPELYLARFGGGRVVHCLLRLLERATYAAADGVMATNGRVAALARTRGRVGGERVTVVPNGPDLESLRAVAPRPGLRAGRRHLLCYVGLMGPQDGVEDAVRALAALHRARGDDWRAVFIGDGTSRAAAESLARSLGVGDQVEFLGYLPWEELIPYVSTADVCLAPDRASAFNQLVTQNKIIEYMALGRPVVAFDLAPTRDLAGDVIAYARSERPEDFAERISMLLDDPGSRDELGRRGEALARGTLSWEHSAEPLRRAYARLLAPAG